MTNLHRAVSAVVVLVSGASFAMPSQAFAQFGKGMMKGKTEVALPRRVPPKVVVAGPAVKVEVVSRAGRDNLAERFHDAVERQLVVNDPGVKLGQPEADTLVRCTITRFVLNQTAGSRVEYVSKQTGTKQELNSKTGKMESKPVYESLPETKYFTTVNADLRVEVRVRAIKSGAWISSRTYLPAYSKEYAAGVMPPEQQIETTLVASGARAAAAEVTPSLEPVTVMLGRPNGDVDDLNKLAQAGLWSRMADELERMKPLSDPKKDAYRLFNIGVATEAQAYAAVDLAATQRLLERASVLYARALQQKPDEEYFQPPLVRIKESIAQFAEFERQQGLIASGGSLPEVTSPGAADPAVATPPAAAAAAVPATGSGMSNKDVIDLARAGLSEENLIAAIKDAKMVKFDLSVDGLKALMAAKVPNTVIAAMRARLL